MAAFTDLDELLLSCRDDGARRHLDEAVRCYRAGALRAATVAAWNAVAYDFISKLDELRLQGDRQAEQLHTSVMKSHATHNVQGLLKFEREILNEARERFGFLSELEKDDLSRLLADRQRCAHPSLDADAEMYAPSAEQVRAHIKHAVTHMLSRPPVCGKAALDRLMNEVVSASFPQHSAAARRVLEAGPLAHPSQSLLRNFVILVLKNALL